MVGCFLYRAFAPTYALPPMSSDRLYNTGARLLDRPYWRTPTHGARRYLATAFAILAMALASTWRPPIMVGCFLYRAFAPTWALACWTVQRPPMATAYYDQLLLIPGVRPYLCAPAYVRRLPPMFGDRLYPWHRLL
jgi:hypothetical protein